MCYILVCLMVVAYTMGYQIMPSGPTCVCKYPLLVERHFCQEKVNEGSYLLHVDAVSSVRFGLQVTMKVAFTPCHMVYSRSFIPLISLWMCPLVMSSCN